MFYKKKRKVYVDMPVNYYRKYLIEQGVQGDNANFFTGVFFSVISY